MKKRIVVFAGNECVVERETYYYSLAYQTGKLLAQNGFVVVTGGGPGLMNEVSRGAFENDGETIGVCLTVAGRKQSKFLSKKYLYHSLNKRQNKLISLGDGFVALPGGVGTFYEIFAILALKRKLEISKDQPFILIDPYYQGFMRLVDLMKSEGFVTADIDVLFTLVNSPEEAIKLLLP